MAQAQQAASIVTGNATTASAAAPAMEPVLSAQAGSASVSAGNATSVPGLTTPDSVFAWGGYFEALGWLCFALAVLWFILWLLKRRGVGFGSGATAGMRIESRLALGPKKWVIITRYQDRRLILGVTEQQITLLSDLPASAPEGNLSADKQEASFAALLKKETPSS